MCYILCQRKLINIFSLNPQIEFTMLMKKFHFICQSAIKLYRTIIVITIHILKSHSYLWIRTEVNKAIRMKLALLVLPALVATIHAHSWLTCTDYLEQNGEYFSHEFCRAYPRMASRYARNGGLHGLVKSMLFKNLIFYFFGGVVLIVIPQSGVL